MRVAIVSDIHGNRSALEAVLRDLGRTSPDLVLHGGDLADAGPSPAEVLDRVRDLGWPGVLGNTDEMLFRPGSLQEFASSSAAPKSLFAAIEEMAQATRAELGPARLEWLRGLPRRRDLGPIALMHASPETPWRAPSPEASDAELASVYGGLAQPVVVYGHVHRPFVRRLGARIVANCGSVGLPHDGDRRAAYLLVEDGQPEIRRVEYDVGAELAALARSGRPHAAWVARTVASARPEMP